MTYESDYMKMTGTDRDDDKIIVLFYVILEHETNNIQRKEKKMDTREEEKCFRELMSRYVTKVVLLVLLGIAACVDAVFGEACVFAIIGDIDRNVPTITNPMFLMAAVMIFIELMKAVVTVSGTISEMHANIAYIRKYLLNEDNQYRIK